MGIPAEVMDIMKNPLTIDLFRAICMAVIVKDLSNLIHQLEIRIMVKLRFILHIYSLNIAIIGNWNQNL